MATGHGLVSSYRPEEPGIKLRTPGYKASGLSTTPQRFPISILCLPKSESGRILNYLFISSSQGISQIVKLYPVLQSLAV